MTILTQFCIMHCCAVHFFLSRSVLVNNLHIYGVFATMRICSAKIIYRVIIHFVMFNTSTALAVKNCRRNRLTYRNSIILSITFTFAELEFNFSIRIESHSVQCIIIITHGGGGDPHPFPAPIDRSSSKRSGIADT